MIPAGHGFSLFGERWEQEGGGEGGGGGGGGRGGRGGGEGRKGGAGGTSRLDHGVSLCFSRSLSVAPAHIHPSRFIRVVLSRNQLLASLKQGGYEEVEVKPTPPLP